MRKKKWAKKLAKNRNPIGILKELGKKDPKKLTEIRKKVAKKSQKMAKKTKKKHLKNSKKNSTRKRAPSGEKYSYQNALV